MHDVTDVYKALLLLFTLMNELTTMFFFTKNFHG